ncbi:30S ribosomal protein S6 [Candidatus Saccharibacteria bacterium]|nr:MAG: 30S ribosomal protein S6 [Candidatus Saccharibacteria bacterium]
MNQYELTVLINPDLEPKLDDQIKKVKDLVEAAGGSVEAEDNQGKQRLAYSIDRQDFAIYVYMDVKLPADAPQKISAKLNITSGVMRYLLVKADPKLRAQREAAEQETSDEE